jgi:hypothetical protein
MPKFLVRLEAIYTATIEAEDEDAAMEKAPDVPDMGDWEKCDDGMTAEELEED